MRNMQARTNALAHTHTDTHVYTHMHTVAQTHNQAHTPHEHTPANVLRIACIYVSDVWVRGGMGSVYIFVRVSSWCVYLYMHAKHASAHPRTRTHTRMHTCLHARTQTHTIKHTRSHVRTPANVYKIARAC